MTIDRPRADTSATALATLLRVLAARDYRFVTPTPATHARVVARPDRAEAHDLADMLGWSRPYRPDTIDAEVERLLDAAGATAPAPDGRRRSLLRVSSLHDRLLLHSAFPTTAADAVFFGPDSYRFADLIRSELTACPPRPHARIVDVGTGAGVGGIVAATACADAAVHLTDINLHALRLARINAAAAGLAVTTSHGPTLDDVPGAIDVVTVNPPFIIDHGERLYRHGGPMHGGQVALDMAAMALARLAPGGRLILYTGSAIVRGVDRLRLALEDAAAAHDGIVRYREIDPDIFGEELEHDAYREVDRIALVACVVTRAG